MDLAVGDVTALRFDDGAPVRAASAIVPFGGGWLVAQDDATYAAWWRGDWVTRVRVLPSAAGLDTFEKSAGTKHLKPDLEGAFPVPGDGGAVVLLGSGSASRRTRACLLRPGRAGPVAVVADLSGLYVAAGRALEVPPELLNFEAACVVGATVRWFQRGVPAAGVATASVDVDLDGLLAAIAGEIPVTEVVVTAPRAYDLGEVGGVGLAITDAVRLRDGSTLVSAAAEDTDDPRLDGPVVGCVLAVLRDGVVVRSAVVPGIRGAVPKIEGLAVIEDDSSAPTGAGVRLLATVDSDDATAPSLAVSLNARW